MTQEELELKKYKLEILKAVLSVISPLIVLWVGLKINSRLEEQKEILAKVGLQEQKIDLMQKIVPQLFDTNNTKSFAMMYLLKNIDSAMAEGIHIILIKRYRNLKEDNDVSKSNSLLSAAESYDTRLADTMKIIDSKFRIAASYDKMGYEEIAARRVNSAISYFTKADSVYPTFRQSYEIKSYLHRNKRNLQDSGSQSWKEAFRTIANDYNAYIPADLKTHFQK